MNKYYAQEIAFKNGYEDGKKLMKSEVDSQYGLGFELAQDGYSMNIIAHFEQTIKYLQQKYGENDLVLKLKKEVENIKSTM